MRATRGQHSAKQIRQIADSIREFGFTNPLLIDATAGLFAGHGRLEAAKLLGIAYVPTIPPRPYDRRAEARIT